MQEEVARQAQSKAVMLSIYTTRLTSGVLKAAIRAYLENHNMCGETSLKHLMREGVELSSVDVDAIADFRRIANKYSLRYAVMRSPEETGETPRYLVFFRARNKDVLSMAFQEYVQATERRKAPVIDDILKADKNPGRESAPAQKEVLALPAHTDRGLSR